MRVLVPVLVLEHAPLRLEEFHRTRARSSSNTGAPRCHASKLGPIAFQELGKGTCCMAFLKPLTVYFCRFVE